LPLLKFQPSYEDLRNAAKSDRLMVYTMRRNNMVMDLAVLLHVVLKWDLRGTNIPLKLAMPTLRRTSRLLRVYYSEGS